MNLLEKIQQEITSYFPKLASKLQTLGQTSLTIVQPDDTHKGLQLILAVLDEVLQIVTDLNQQYSQLEEQLQKYEAECRSHIRTEQRLKIHCENIQELYEEQQKVEKDNKAIICNLQKDVLNLRKENEQLKTIESSKAQVKTSSVIEKLLEQQKQTLDLNKRATQSISSQLGTSICNNFTYSNIKFNQPIQIKMNRKTRLMTEHHNDGLTMQVQQINRSKQSIDERQYSSLEKIQDLTQLYSRPKSRQNQETLNRKSNTIHVSQYKSKQLPKKA